MSVKINLEKTPASKDFAGFHLYRIYYDDKIVYVGRTMQPLQKRLHDHLFKKPMHREIDINLVTKIEYATFQSLADMYLYEIYYINRFKPTLNKDDKAFDELTVTLPEVEWKTFTTPLWNKWKIEVAKREEEARKLHQEKMERIERNRKMRGKLRRGEITEEEYSLFLEEIAEVDIAL